MIHLFEAWTEEDYATEKYKEKESYYELETNVQRYIFSRLLEVMEVVTQEDIGCVRYLEVLYVKVLADRSIPEEERSLLDLLGKMEQDLMRDRQQYLGTAGFALGFLEADILMHTDPGRNQSEEKRLLGRIHAIRNQWIREQEPQRKERRDKLKPLYIKNYLDDYIIGQEDAKKIISTAVYGHMKRIWHPDEKFASNVVLLIGPSGCGKTEIMRRIRDITDLPMVFTDVSSLGASQYRGRHKEDVLLSLWEAAGQNIKLAEKGIIFMDEFDKLLLPAVSEKGVDMHDDVQAQLLTMLEGSDVELKDGKETFYLNTSGILFVLAGAFQGIEDYIKEDQMKRKALSGNIGFMSTPVKEMDLSMIRENINHDVLIRYGMKRELAGRIGSIAVLEKLDREALIRILTDTKDSIIKRYSSEFALGSHLSLEFTRGALELIADKVLGEPIGARALYHVIRNILRDSLFERPGKNVGNKLLVTDATIKCGTQPALIYEEDWISAWKPEEDEDGNCNYWGY